jgi:hypothetical protein
MGAIFNRSEVLAGNITSFLGDKVGTLHILARSIWSLTPNTGADQRNSSDHIQAAGAATIESSMIEIERYKLTSSPVAPGKTHMILTIAGRLMVQAPTVQLCRRGPPVGSSSRRSGDGALCAAHRARWAGQ